MLNALIFKNLKYLEVYPNLKIFLCCCCWVVVFFQNCALITRCSQKRSLQTFCPLRRRAGMLLVSRRQLHPSPEAVTSKALLTVCIFSPTLGCHGASWVHLDKHFWSRKDLDGLLYLIQFAFHFLAFVANPHCVRADGECCQLLHQLFLFCNPT